MSGTCHDCDTADERERRLEAVFALRAVPALIAFVLLAAQVLLISAGA